MAKKTKASALAERYLAKTKTPAYLLQEDSFPIPCFYDSGNYALNALLSGDWKDGGYPAGRVTQLAGPNSVGKTYLFTEAIVLAQKKQKALIHAIDSEFGSDAQSWINRGVNPALFIHNPIYHIKQVTSEVLSFITEVKPADNAVVLIDSVGNLSSNKETADLLAGKDTADMTRAKELKAMFRQILIPAGKAGVPIWVVNHEYQTIGLFSSKVQGGGTGPGYGSSIVVSMTKAKDKTKDKIVTGTVLNCTSVKNRFAKEQSKISIIIDFESGLSRYSGLFALALEGGFITSPTQGYYSHHGSDKKNRMTFYANNPELWEELLANGFGDWINDKFRYKSHAERESAEPVSSDIDEELYLEEEEK